MFCRLYRRSRAVSRRGGSEPEIEARIGIERRGNIATPCVQCRFKMASVRDRYRGIAVEMSVFVMYLVVGRPEGCPGTTGRTPRKPAPDHDVRILNHIAPTLSYGYVERGANVIN